MKRPRPIVGIGLLIGIAVITTIVVFLLPPIAQDPSYHDYADKRTLFGIPNFWPVVSNIAYFIVGIWGLVVVNHRPRQLFVAWIERWLWNLFFLSVVLLTLGSAFYHLDPNNLTLVGDRLAIGIGSMLLFAVIISERISSKAALWLVIPLVLLGIVSVIYWEYTENLGRGDLRLYGLVQFYPLIAIPLLCLFFAPSYPGIGYLLVAIAWYLVSKFFELYDWETYGWTRELIAGHVLKHLTSAIAVGFLVLYIQCRRRQPSRPI